MKPIPFRRPPSKLPVDPSRIRSMPAQFAPIDRRLIYDRHLCVLTHAQMALYLFLHCVGDAAGLSYYSDERICQFLRLGDAALREARQGLIQQQFILYRRPMYQLLDLPQLVSTSCPVNPPCAPSEPGSSRPSQSPRKSVGANGEAAVIGEIISQWCSLGGQV
ncbi:MAG: hypothetical protein WCJ35_26500 [Planctomycetota bacterium]